MTLFLSHLSNVFVFNLAKKKKKSSENDLLLYHIPDSVPISLRKLKPYKNTASLTSHVIISEEKSESFWEQPLTSTLPFFSSLY